MTSYTNMLMAQAGIAHGKGRLDEAESLARQVLAQSPGHSQAHLLLGVLAGKASRDAEAFEHVEKALEANPDSYEGLFWMAQLHRRNLDPLRAIDFARRAVAVRPGDAFGLHILGLCLLDELRFEEAIDVFEQAANDRPDLAELQQSLGMALYGVGRVVEAVYAYERAVELNPRDVQSVLNLGHAMLSQGEPASAIEYGRRAVAMEPDNPAAQLLLASALFEDENPREAVPHLDRAIALDPQDARSSGLLGTRLQTLGRFDEANVQFLRSIKAEPRQGYAYFGIVQSKRISEDDLPMIAQMERVAAENRLPPRELQLLHYALARSFENLKQFDKAMPHFDEANRITYRLYYGDAEFDRESYARDLDETIERFTPECLENHKGAGDPTEVPIIVMGMMRSGTTFAEQIISSHSKVGPAGEDPFWPDNWMRVLGRANRTADSSAPGKVGAEYLRRLRRVSPNSEKVTDKMPANYAFLGPIHVALPNARLIHMRRNPLDTCISIYTTPNRVHVPFANNLGNIAFAYEQYLRVMQHWRTILPKDRFLEIDYEELVVERESVTRRILEFCGLEWEDAVLSHERNERNVATPSVWQVRQQTYTSSIERWRNYEPWLESFSKLV